MLTKLVRLAKRRGIIFQNSEIYGGLSGFYDYGPIGLKIKANLEKFWREFFIKNDENIFEIETSLIMPEKVWEASGHLKDFVDPLTQCKKCNSTFRADNLIEECTGKFVEGLDSKELTKILKKEKIKCPKCKGELSEVRVFNLMFFTQIGPVKGSFAYLRPETAQGIFVNFKNVFNAMRTNLPIGIAQIGYSFRNEISPRQWIIRLREFRQMEIEYFFDPNKPTHPKFKEFENVKIRILTREAQQKNGEPIEITAKEAVERGILPNDIMAYFLAKEFIWYQKLGIPSNYLRFRHMLPEETPHYSKGNFDLEIKFDFGWKEVVGNAYRTDFDLKMHMKFSKQDLSVVVNGKKIVPHVVEPSFGIDRTIYAILLHNFVEDKKRGWDWLRLPIKIAPFIAGIFPLMKKDNLPKKAREIYFKLKQKFEVFYDETGSIGKRYARADEIGVPFCITIDYETLENDTVTIRDRDTTEQKRVESKELEKILENLLSEKITFKDI